MDIAAIILSGGKGLRFGSDLPKQYLNICGEPVLAHTLRAFEKSRVTRILIVAAEEHADRCRDIAKASGCSKLEQVIEGGKERYDSVLNGLRYLQQTSSLKDDRDSLVLIHDGARPCIQPDTINQIIEAVSQTGAAIAGTPCTDTIKIIDPDRNIISTTERAFTWAAQTPQAFHLQEISDAYEQVVGSGADSEMAESSTGAKPRQITDDAMVYQLAFPGRPVQMIDAGASNIKITNAADLSRAEMILAGGGRVLQKSS